MIRPWMTTHATLAVAAISLLVLGCGGDVTQPSTPVMIPSAPAPEGPSSWIAPLGEEHGTPEQIAVTAERVVVCGSTGQDAYVHAWHRNGTPAWSRRFGSMTSACTGVVALSDGSVVIAVSAGPADRRAFVERIAQSGRSVWRRELAGEPVRGPVRLSDDTVLALDGVRGEIVSWRADGAPVASRSMNGLTMIAGPVGGGRRAAARVNRLGPEEPNPAMPVVSSSAVVESGVAILPVNETEPRMLVRFDVPEDELHRAQRLLAVLDEGIVLASETVEGPAGRDARTIVTYVPDGGAPRELARLDQPRTRWSLAPASVVGGAIYVWGMRVSDDDRRARSLLVRRIAFDGSSDATSAGLREILIRGDVAVLSVVVSPDESLYMMLRGSPEKIGALDTVGSSSQWLVFLSTASNPADQAATAGDAR